ncbi:MAG: hypothetical protein K2F82_07685 [Muribaculaceae bacterium]|nr:hypothetical protein [Muribaculaceae bacterium]MDE6316355.1 hypothetical protein [Muribaculaceae bacterium]
MNKNYRIKDLTPADPSRPSNLDDKLVSGRILKYVGLNIASSIGRPYASVALSLTAE